ncbi:MAG: hypothetical protein ACJ8J0_01010 [Longimicrobiaceae bacterium]
MDEELEIALQVTRVFEALDVPYLVGGSLASSYHGLPRSTQDADLVADLTSSHVPLLVSALRDSFYLDEAAIRDAVERRSTFNLIHLETMFKVDVFVARNDAATRQEMERRRKRILPGEPEVEVVFASPEDVVIQKLHWYRLGDHVSERQWADVMGVLKVRGKQLDLAYMRELAAEMGVNDLLESALREARLQL